MYIVTASGIKPIRPTQTVVVRDRQYVDWVEVPINSPLPDVATHAVASSRYLGVLHRFLQTPSSRFLDRVWQDAKSTATRGMIGS